MKKLSLLLSVCLLTSVLLLTSGCSKNKSTINEKWTLETVVQYLENNNISLNSPEYYVKDDITLLNQQIGQDIILEAVYSKELNIYKINKKTAGLQAIIDSEINNNEWYLYFSIPGYVFAGDSTAINKFFDVKKLVSSEISIFEPEKDYSIHEIANFIFENVPTALEAEFFFEENGADAKVNAFTIDNNELDNVSIIKFSSAEDAVAYTTELTQNDSYYITSTFGNIAVIMDTYFNEPSFYEEIITALSKNA